MRARVRRLEQRIAEATRPGIAQLLREARERLKERRETTPPEVIKAEDRARWEQLAARTDDDSIAVWLARARLRLLAEEGKD
ncbi:hypothetical protein [Pseudaquabacterium pictum]|nr:hypothetical protein [Rubrivivax pictus]